MVSGLQDRTLRRQGGKEAVLESGGRWGQKGHSPCLENETVKMLLAIGLVKVPVSSK